MYKELYELIKKMKNQLLHNQGLILSKEEVRMIVRYINELEIEISGGAEE